jgi:hypothetical protein
MTAGSIPVVPIDDKQCQRAPVTDTYVDFGGGLRTRHFGISIAPTVLMNLVENDNQLAKSVDIASARK